MQNILNNTIKIGIKKPFTLLHCTDTHLCFADGRDGERKTQLAERRIKGFPNASEYLEEWADIGEKEGDLLIHTGDMIDFVSEKNLEYANTFSKKHDYLFIAGNHEFSLYVGEAWEDEAYRNQSLNKVNAAFGRDVRFNSRIVNGVNFVGIDNSYYIFEPAQLTALKSETAKGFPIILFVHTPFYDKKLFDICMKDSDNAGLLGVPDELMRGYSDHRYRQQAADETTKEAFAYIKNEPLIKAVVAGHLHFDYEGFITPELPQLVTGIGTLRRINIV